MRIFSNCPNASKVQPKQRGRPCQISHPLGTITKIQQGLNPFGIKAIEEMQKKITGLVHQGVNILSDKI
jgi:hypothetical protein